MSLVSFVKSVLGLGSDSEGDSAEGSHNGDRPNTENEAAVKGTDESVAAETDASASTGSMTEEPPTGKPDEDDPVESAAEPAEAAGPESQVEEDVESDVAADDELEADAQAEPEAESEAVESASGTEEPSEAAESTETTDADEGAAAAGAELTDVNGIGPAYAKRLNEAGVDSVADLLAADAEELADETGVSEKRIGRWIENAADV